MIDLEFWQSNVFWGVAGILGGLVISAFFFFVGKSRKILEYYVSSTQLITEDMTKIPGLKITIDQQPIKNLTSTVIMFTNVGNQTILPSDFAAVDPLGVAVNGQFLNIANGCTISTDSPNASPRLNVLDDFTLGIEFDFLKPRKSLYVILLHSGKIVPTGELKDGKMRELRDSSRPLINVAMLLSLAMMFVFALPWSLNFNNPDNSSLQGIIKRIGFWSSSIITLVFLFYCIYRIGSNKKGK